MEIKFLKLSLLTLLSLFVFSCEETLEDDIQNPDQEQVDGTNGNDEKCPEVNLDIRQKDGFDIKVYAKEITGATYQWTVEKDGQIEETDGYPGHPYILAWSPNVGNTTFCVTITTDTCPGEKYCTSFTATEEQFKEGNTTNAKISVIQNDNGVFTYKIDKRDTTTKECPSDVTIDLALDGFLYIRPTKIGDARYVYKINGQIVENTGTIDTELEYEVDQDTKYEICVLVKTDQCPDGKLFCKEYRTPKEENPSCKEVNFTIEAFKGLDIRINAPSDPLNKGFTYEWKITSNPIKGDATTSLNVANGDNIFTWGIQSGTFDFCLTVKSDQCTEGVTTCKKLIIPEGFVDLAQNSVNTKKIAVEITSNGNLKLILVDK